MTKHRSILVLTEKAFVSSPEVSKILKEIHSQNKSTKTNSYLVFPSYSVISEEDDIYENFHCKNDAENFRQEMAIKNPINSLSLKIITQLFALKIRAGRIIDYLPPDLDFESFISTIIGFMLNYDNFKSSCLWISEEEIEIFKTHPDHIIKFESFDDNADIEKQKLFTKNAIFFANAMIKI